MIVFDLGYPSFGKFTQHNSRPMRTQEEAPSNNRNNNADRNAPIATNHRAANSDT